MVSNDNDYMRKYEESDYDKMREAMRNYEYAKEQSKEAWKKLKKVMKEVGG